MDLNKLKQDLIDSRGIKPISAQMYVNNIKKLHKLLGNTSAYNYIQSLNFLKQKDKVLEAVKDKALTTRKNYLASIVVVLMLDDKYKALTEEYRKDMDSLSTEDKQLRSTQTKSDKQEKNWTTVKALQSVLNLHKKILSAKGIFNKSNTKISPKDMDLLQQYLVGSLYIGDPDNHPPLRMDYTPMEIISGKEYSKLPDDKNKKNYLINASPNKKVFSFNEYKTYDKMGELKIPVSKKINNILNHWLRYNKTNHLLINSKGTVLTSNALTKLLQKTFSTTGKSISGNMLRHIYLSEKFPAQNTEKESIADKMGHSPAMANLYSLK